MAGQTKVVFVLLLAVAATAFDVGLRRCPAGWEDFQGRCFKYHGIKLDWASAEKHCLNLGANLISIHSEEEYLYAKSIIRAQNPGEDPTWIGLYTGQKTGNWFWSDGSQLIFTQWNPGEPNGPQSELCAHMNFANPFTSDKNWNDISCNNLYAFVCVRRRLHHPC